MLVNDALDLKNNELRRARMHLLSADPTLTSGDAGRIWYDTAATQFKGWNGAAVQRLTNLIEGISATGAIKAAAPDGAKNVALTIDSAGASQPGVMSAAHYNLLAAASSSSNPSALVQRDASGNFAAGTITANLTGTASNASQLGGASLTQVRDFSQTSGQRAALSAINDFMAQVYTARLDQMATPTGPVAMGSQRQTGLADPINPQDSATKNYVDSVATGLDTKASVRAATTAALPANSYSNGSAGVGATLTAAANGTFPTLDSTYTPVNGDRILVKNEASPANNGIYVLTSAGSAGTPWVLTRATDADNASELTPGMFTFVEAGQSQIGSGWVVNTATNPIVIGSTAITFAQFSGGQAYTPGNGLTLAGSAFAVVGTANRIVSTASGVDIASNYVGQTSITTVGSITTGTWNGGVININKGGTGSGTAAGARANLGAAGASTIADIGAIAAGGTAALANPLGTANAIAQVVNNSTNDVEWFDVNITAATITITNGAMAIAAGAYRLVVVG